MGFMTGSRLLLDQGDIPIDMIHLVVEPTIQDKPIELVKTISSTVNLLICFEKNALGVNCPHKKTVLTPEQLVAYKGKMQKAYTFLSTHNHSMVYSVPYKNQIIYNVVVVVNEDCRINTMNMNINGMILEVG